MMPSNNSGCSQSVNVRPLQVAGRGAADSWLALPPPPSRPQMSWYPGSKECGTATRSTSLPPLCHSTPCQEKEISTTRNSFRTKSIHAHHIGYKLLIQHIPPTLENNLGDVGTFQTLLNNPRQKNIPPASLYTTVLSHSVVCLYIHLHGSY